MRVSKAMAFSHHDWEEITANGFGTRHSAAGEWLYGYEMAVDPKLRGLRIGQRLYDERKELAEELDLHGIVIAGRMPGYARAKRRAGSAADYLEKVVSGKLRDQVISFQLKNQFEPLGVLENYLPEDKQSDGHAAHLVWRNPYVDPDEAPEMRVSSMWRPIIGRTSSSSPSCSPCPCSPSRPRSSPRSRRSTS